MVRRVLITGANKGIGLAIANRCLADHNARNPWMPQHLSRRRGGG